MRPASGEIVGGRYRLERPLGEGGMGAVWAATHTVTGKAVALKFLLGRGDDPALRERLLREARAVCSILHPHVVPVHDVLELEGGAPALVIDLLTGESLRAKLDREGRLAHEEVTRIAIDVLSALAAAHACGIVHRDLKPDNVFLSRTPGGKIDEVKVLDFGIAKVTPLGQGETQAAALTRTDAMVGTPYYMAPEQVYGERDIDARSDLWSMGIVMYECLAGVRPTEGANLGQIFKLVTIGPFPELAEKAPLVPPALAKLVASCLQRSRDARPRSATELREALEGVRAGTTMDGAEVAARAVDVVPTSPRERATRGWALSAVGVIAVVGAIGGGVAWVASPNASASPNANASTSPNAGRGDGEVVNLVNDPAPPPRANANADAAGTGAALASASAPALSPSLAPAPNLALAPVPALSSSATKPRPRPTVPAADAPKDERAAGKVVVTPPF